MEIKDFLDSTVKEMDEENLAGLMKKLVDEYLTFSYVDKRHISKYVFGEKLADYFEKTEIKTGEKFKKLLSRYMDSLDEVVKRFVPEEKKGAPLPRSRRYYEHAKAKKGTKNRTMDQVEDFSRIMLSLYMSSINAEMKAVDTYTFSCKELDIDKILIALKAEKEDANLLGIGFIPVGKKLKFNPEENYGKDKAIFMITVIMYYHIKNNEQKGE